MTRKEAGYITETLTLAALQSKKNAMIFCNPPHGRDWYINVFPPKRPQIIFWTKHSSVKYNCRPTRSTLSIHNVCHLQRSTGADG